jgi:uncharacterized protein
MVRDAEVDRGWIRQESDGSVVLSLRVVPGARREEFSPDSESPRLKIKEKAVEGAANRGVIRFFSERLGIPRSQVTIVSGERSRKKVLRFRGIFLQQVMNALIPEEIGESDYRPAGGRGDRIGPIGSQ